MDPVTARAAGSFPPPCNGATGSVLIGYVRGRTVGVDALAAQQRVLQDARCERVVE